uniref:Uncharacterized protein n=1 Tax=Oryza meridionalis TaxID=40149 RepID=A0A0E0DC74_9ORYZ
MHQLDDQMTATLSCSSDQTAPGVPCSVTSMPTMDRPEVLLDQTSLPLASRRTRLPSPVNSRTMKTVNRNAWHGGVQKNPAAKEGPYKFCGDRRTMVRTEDPSV